MLMNTHADIVACLNGRIPIWYNNKIKRIILTTFHKLLSNNANARIGIIGLRSEINQSTTRNKFISDRRSLELAFNENMVVGTHANEDQALGDAFQDVLAFDWRDNNNDQDFYEKIAILFTFGDPNDLSTQLRGQDPWVMSNEFLTRKITLFVVGIEISKPSFDIFYCALAENTGGIYIPFVNAKKILTQVINKCVTDVHTLRQALVRIPIKSIEEKSSFNYFSVRAQVNTIINECQTIHDIIEIIEYQVLYPHHPPV